MLCLLQAYSESIEVPLGNVESATAVIFAGGKGTRLREETEFRPKPLVLVDGAPILVHVMKTFHAYGVRRFVILAGYKGEMIREYFLNFKKYSQDIRFNLREPGHVDYLSTDTVPDWDITILDTGADTETGGRLRSARAELESRGKFFLTYGDGLANVNLRDLWNSHQTSGSLVTVSVTKARSKFGHVILDSENFVTGFEEKPRVPDFVNMGYFLIEPKALDYIQDDEPWEASPMTRLASEGHMNAYQHEGFFQSMDTLKEMELLNEMARSTSPYPWLTDKLS